MYTRAKGKIPEDGDRPPHDVTKDVEEVATTSDPRKDELTKVLSDLMLKMQIQLNE